MDEAEGVGGGGGDSVEQFHRNEVISAVTDDGFGEEDDDDYEDLYNDVNVGEGILQSLRKNEDLGVSNEGDTSSAQNQPPVPSTVPESIPSVGERTFVRDVGFSMGRVDGEYQNQGVQPPVQPNGGPSGMGRGYGGNGGGGGLRVELGQNSSKGGNIDEQAVGTSGPGQSMSQPAPPHGINVGGVGAEGVVRQGNMNGAGGNVGGSGSAAVQVTPSSGGAGNGGTILFVGDLHWWTTDAELEAELVKYGPVKEVKFFDEKASGKSKGYCQVEFYDPNAASACKEGMHGQLFNGRPCVVAFASPYNIKRMGESQTNRNQQMTQQPPSQGRRPNDPMVNKPTGNNISTGGNYQGGDQNRNFGGRGNWRGNPQGMNSGRGPMGPMRNRPVGRGMMVNGGNGFGPNPPLMHPQAMMGQGFDPGFGPMGRMGNYGGFPGGPTPPFPGMMSSFPPVGNVGLPGVAPHVNPAFFGRGMPMNGMGGMMPNGGVDGPMGGMWSDPNMGGGGWPGDDHGGRAGESSYGEEAASDHQYGGEASHDRSGWQNSAKDKDKTSERDFSGSSDRRYRDEREPGGYEKDMPREKDAGHDLDWQEKRHREDREARDRERSRDRDRERSRDRDRERSRDRDRERDRDRDRYREDRDRHVDHHRYKDREADYDEEWDRGRSSRTHSKSRISHEEDRSRSRDADYGKRRRITSE
ncbi:hypothetical protein RND81_12G186100 [Saponaria officinalis]|uniref:RRM domain-containing protein n=1 Tax=Saponaria officinalis TaxID=3572 RepID=A0AAW1HCJ1_SAPOF